MALRISEKLIAKVTDRLKWVPKRAVAPGIAALVLVPTVTLAFSYGPMLSVQPENSSLSGGANIVADASASGGQSIRFGSGSGIPVIADFPTSSSVGPAVEPTETYTGDCYFDASESSEVIDGKIIDCAEEGVRFAEDAQGVIFRNSVINGGMSTMASDAANDNDSRPIVYTVEDSRIIQTLSGGEYNWQDRGACCSHYVVKRSLIQGTHSGLLAHNQVTLEGNYITTDGTHTHQSGMRVLKNTIIRGNTITCKPHGNADPGDPAYHPNDDSGCSAHGVYYRERVDGTPAAAYNLTIENNYFKRGVTSGGLSGGPYYATRFIDCASWTDCTGITFTGNLFSLGEGTDGGEFPFYADNVWANNYWTDGQPAESGE